MLINVVVNRLSLYRSFIFSSYNLLTVVVSCCGVVVPSPSVVGSVGGACVDVVLCLPHGYSYLYTKFVPKWLPATCVQFVVYSPCTKMAACHVCTVCCVQCLYQK